MQAVVNCCRSEKNRGSIENSTKLIRVYSVFYVCIVSWGAGFTVVKRWGGGGGLRGLIDTHYGKDTGGVRGYAPLGKILVVLKNGKTCI